MSIADELTQYETDLSASYTACSNKGATIPTDKNFDNLATTIGSITELKGETKTITPTTSQQTITPTSGKNGITQVTVNAVTSSIDNNITAGNIKSGVSILGVSGSVTELKGETRNVSLTNSSGQTFTPSSGKNGITSITVTPNNKARTVTPSTSQQSLSVDSGYSGNGTITVNAVTSAIDNNIIAWNIKDGVSILGVTGNYTGTTPTLTTKNITQNGTYNASSDNVDGYSSVTVNVASGGDGDWQPDPDWWDIKTILENDTRDYAGKAIILYSNSDDFTTLTLSSPTVAVATSDGAFYTSTTTHTWDRSKDKIVSDDTNDTTPKYGTRYLILYFNTASPNYSALTNFYKCSIYAVFKCNLTKVSMLPFGDNSFFYNNVTLQSFDFLTGYNLSFGQNCGHFCHYCYSLVKLPDNLDTSNCTDFSYFCANNSSLEKLPDSLDTSSGTNFSYFCNQCYSMKELPYNLDTSSGTSFTYFCSSNFSMKKLPDSLDVSSGTSFSNFCRYDYSLEKANIKLADVSVTALSKSNVINIQSLEYIANNAPTATGTKTLTIGSTNITRAGGASGTIISTLTNKGWTVN